MGGHQAWRKRVAAGELAKGSGGAALRHRPRLGRKGVEERKLNRLGNIGGRPNPKKEEEEENCSAKEESQYHGGVWQTRHTRRANYIAKDCRRNVGMLRWHGWCRSSLVVPAVNGRVGAWHF